jgi:predicted nucleotide-binding protein (sugar kinase/HSP70/actin superfamily)
MEAENITSFQSLYENVGQFNLRDKTVLFPEMNRIGSHLLAATFRGFGINARVMDTYRGLDLGLEYSSGKECYPCQVTFGDVLFFIERQKKELGKNFDPKNYVYFMPESDGPCRFGMYNKYQRIVLDSFPQLKDLKIGSLTTGDGYSLKGIIDKDMAGRLRKASYLSLVVADSLDRLLWRTRPYEKRVGMADGFISEAMREMEGTFEKHGSKKGSKKILDKLEEIIKEGKQIIDPDIPRKPLIGIVGEIYLRSHIHSNQDLIRVLEKYGAEVVNASIAEWVNYITYSRLRDSKRGLRLYLKQFRLKSMWKELEKAFRFFMEYHYQELKQKQVYRCVRKTIDLEGDHRIGDLEEILMRNDIFNLDIGTEACLSIAGILEYAEKGYNGAVNVYPFTCMPSTVTSAIIKPLMNRIGVPYLDSPYDSSFQPGREADIRTFMYQAYQHMEGNGRKKLHN